ncbi:integrase catalytic domain-containing protein [Trichonephila clavipes]|nr:integrase catalytic domain-containing protein [Trichonephila clavipes]
MPYLDENGLIRLGGRLEFCNMSINEKHPFILPKNSWLTTLIVRREHNKVMHGEEQPVHWHNSRHHYLVIVSTKQQPFQSAAWISLDLYVNNFGELQKFYIVLFTCGVTRALHLELVSDMTTNSFLLAFRRFLVRRGSCKVIYSGNAKTFLKRKLKTYPESYPKAWFRISSPKKGLFGKISSRYPHGGEDFTNVRRDPSRKACIKYLGRLY